MLNDLGHTEEYVIEISRYLNLNDLLKLMLVSKQYKILPGTVWDIQCDRLYSREFWSRAMKIDVKISKPTGSSMLELKRLTEFKAVLFPEVWEESHFFSYWELIADRL